MNGMDAQAYTSKVWRYGEGAGTSRRKHHEEGRTKDGQREQSTQRHPLSMGNQRGRVKEWEHNKQVRPRKRNANATAADKHTMVWHEG